MIKTAKFFMLIFLCSALTSGCSAADGIPTDAAASGKTVVYASFYPMYDFASKAAGDYAEVYCLIPDGVEPHDWEPSPRDIAGLKNSGLFVYSGAGLESWARQIIKQTGEGLLAVEASAGVDTDMDGDPHIWLSPKLAKRQFGAICEALAEADPSNAEGYLRKRTEWEVEFDKLDAEYAVLKDMPRKTIIVTHAAFGHMCGEYGLEQMAAEGSSTDAEPDPASMARLVEYARENGITTVFYAELSGLATAGAIAREIGAETAALSPLEGLTDEQRENGGDYFSVMRENLAALKAALE